MGGSGAVGRVKEGERIGFNRELGRRDGQMNTTKWERSGLGGGEDPKEKEQKSK